MIARRVTLAVLALGAALTPQAVNAQAGRDRPRRIAILTPGANPDRIVFQAFRERLRELGRVEHRDIVVTFYLADGAARLPEFAARIHADGADVVVADGQLASAALHERGCGIPIVSVAGVDPVARGYAASLARPGGCMTGVATISDLLAPKQLELLKEMVPGARRIGVVFAAINEPTRRGLEERARALDLALRFIEVSRLEHLARALGDDALADVDALVAPPSPLIAGMAARISALIAAAGKPALFGDRDFVAEGGLALYTYDIADAYRLLAVAVDRILKGVPVGTLPYEQPTRIELTVNLRTARALALEVPLAILARADEVIE